MKCEERERERQTCEERDRHVNRSHVGSSSLHSELESNGTIRGYGSRPRWLPSWRGQLLVGCVLSHFRRRCCLFRPAEEADAASSVERDSFGKVSAVCELPAEVQELRLVVRRLAGSIMWDRGAVILGKRIPELIVGQTVDMSALQIALQHAHFGSEPFGEDGRKYLMGRTPRT